jgi:hypothetical protein
MNEYEMKSELKQQAIDNAYFKINYKCRVCVYVLLLMIIIVSRFVVITTTTTTKLIIFFFYL